MLGDLIGLPPVELRRVQRMPKGTSGGLYSSLRMAPSHWLSLEAGVRWDYQDYGEQFEQQTSPRFSALFQVGDNTEVRVSAGRFFQAEQIHELQAADGIERYQSVQRADHLIAGLLHQFDGSGLSLRMEGFYKRFRQPKRRFENLFNSLVLMPEIASDRVPVAPDSLRRAKGVEASLAYQPSAFAQRLAWLHLCVCGR